MSPSRRVALALVVWLALAAAIAFLMPDSISRVIIGLATDPLAGGTPSAMTK